ncbi:heterodisulfide reductase-related iron-sulfur binding cluster [Xanthobacter sp. TB0139]|uniref:heterodisulfide reductase-related iron-sulfur binding cluster n=1 Tax=Xanthobacter sp. TB0139 TaxID=3459178 RepID=UPI004039381E
MIVQNHNPEEVTRTLFESFPGWAVGLFYVVGFSAIAIFIYGCFIQYRKYSRGQPLKKTLPLLAQRVREMVTAVGTHRTLRRRDKAAGIAHAFIFFGFALLFIGTSTITLEYDILDPITGMKFWYGDFYLVFSLILDLAGLGLIVALLYMMVRRGWIKPPKLDYKRPDRAPDAPDADRSFYRIEDWAFLWLLLIIGVTGFLLEAAREVWLMNDPVVWDYRWWSPIGTLVAYAYIGLGLTPEAAATLRAGLWWFHGILSLSFVALVPFTKAKHIFTAMGSLAMRDPQPVQKLAPVDMAADSVGATRITDFTWKQLLHFDACTKCGRCHEACPANASGAPLSPRDLILTLRELSEATLSGLKMPEPERLIAQGDGLFQVPTETLWACRTCAACVEICPVGIEHVPVIVEMRRALVEQGEMDPMVQKSLQNIQKRGNSFGETKKKRQAWTKRLDFEIKDARAEAVDVLWFVGDFASFDPRYQRVSADFARIMRAAGIDFGILYEDESNAGNDVRRVGEEGLYQHLAENNIEVLSGCEFKRIVTTDPHSYNTLKNEYPEFGGTYEVEHASAFIARLLNENRIPLNKKLDGQRVTFHDPCHLGRYNKGYDGPREAIKSLGVDLVELKRSRDNSFCCGAGGGRIWTPDPVGLEKPSENRVREAATIEGLETLVVSCPKCMNMLEDARKTTNNEDNFEIREVIELVAECLDESAFVRELETV